jgi:phosphatidylserine decarboxylase
MTPVLDRPRVGPVAPSARTDEAAGALPEPPRGSALRRFFQEDLNFLLTNRIPRRGATLFMNWFSRIELAPVRALSITAWRRFTPDLDLSEAEERPWRSLNDCFTRRLKPGVRAVDPDPAVVVSPCDAIVGACGRLRGVEAIQAKGMPYTLRDLLAEDELVERHRDGVFVTLRLKGSMYHRFHAPCAGRLDRVQYISGDTWNVNPIAVRRVERLFCRNERAVLPLQPRDGGFALTLVPVAAVLVASIRMHCLPAVLDLRYRGPNRIPCDARFERGDELGWFEQGSTILVFASGDVRLHERVEPGARVRMGEALLRTGTAGPSHAATQS